MTIVARTRENPLSLVSALRSEVKKLDRDIPVYNIRTMDQALGSTLELERFTMFLVSIFAAVALTLAIPDTPAGRALQYEDRRGDACARD